MKVTQVTPKKRFHYLIISIIAITILFAMPQFVNAGFASNELSPREAVEHAWARAQQSGQYEYRSSAKQITHPAPAISNAGRSPEEENLAIQGQFNSEAEELEFTFWRDGSFDPETGTEIRSDGEQAWSRTGQGEWEPIEDFSGAFAPGGDPMAFLNGMRNIQAAGTDTRSFPEAGIELTFHHYTFDFSGLAFGEYLRDQMEIVMLERGELPTGLSLAIPDAYVNATGSGEIWIDDDGLPARFSLMIDYGRQDDGTSIESFLTTDYTDYGQDHTTAAALTAFENPSTWITQQLAYVSSPTVVSRLQIALWSIVFALTLTIVTWRYWRTKRFHALMSIYIIFTMVIGPLMSASHVSAFHDTIYERATAQEAQRAEAEEQAEAFAAAQQPTFNPTTDPLSNPVLATSVESRAPLLVAPAAAATNLVVDNTDTDGDGLTDIDEDKWFSCSGVANDIYCNGVADATDTDGDGLTDGEEVLKLGTTPTLVDSDGDTIADNLEVAGFLVNDTRYYLDPSEQDSNRDGVPDGAECFEWSSANANFDPSANCPDSDGDGEPDVYDLDNDGDGVEDAVDQSMYGVYTGYTPDSPFNLQIDNLETDKPVIVTFELRPENAEDLASFGHVLDWPSGDREGQIQRTSDTTWATTSSEYVRNDANADHGDLRLIPMLEIFIPASATDNANLPLQSNIQRTQGMTVGNWIDSELLAGYGVNVLDIPNANGTPSGDLVAYAPLAPISNPTGDGTAAFTAQMIYQPGTASNENPLLAAWGNTHEYRLVWMVQMLTDICPQGNPDCQDNERTVDQLAIIHNYYENWNLTGFSIREQHGVSATVIYEDPAIDGNVNHPEELYNLTWNLGALFATGRDCGSITDVEATCTPDGNRDVTVDNMAASVATWTNGANTALTVAPITTYTTSDELDTIGQDVARDILATTFQANHANDNPTLLFAYEYTERSLDLESPQATPGSTPVFDLVDIKTITKAGYNWGSYQFINNEWDDIPLDQRLTQIDALLQQNEAYFTAAGTQAGIETEAEAIAAARAKRIMFQIIYASVYDGVGGIVEYDNLIMTGADYDVATLTNRWSEINVLPTTGANVEYAAGIVQAFVQAFAAGTVSKIEGFSVDFRSSSNGISTIEFRNEGKFWQAFGDQFSETADYGFTSDVSSKLDINFKGTWTGGFSNSLNILGKSVAFASAVAFVLALACQVCSDWTGIIINSIEIAANLIDIANLIGVLRTLSQLNQVTSFSQIANSSGVATVVIAIITIIILWAFYLANYANKGRSMTKRLVTALTTAATLATVFFTVLALIALAAAAAAVTVIGIVLVVLLFIALAIIGIWEAICGIAGSCTGPVSAVTEWFAELLTEQTTLITNLESEDRLKISIANITIANRREGFTSDNALVYTVAITNTLQTENIPPSTSTFDARQATFEYTAQTDRVDPYPDLEIGLVPTCDVPVTPCYTETDLGIRTEEIDLPDGETTEYEVQTMQIESVNSVTANVDLSNVVGINQNIGSNIIIGESFSIPIELCDTWLFGAETNCRIYGSKAESPYDPEEPPGWNPISLGSGQTFDILPPTVGEFVDLSWNDTGTISWPIQKDADNDGLLSVSQGGLDSNDRDADSDNDGLTDALEASAGTNQNSVDSDNDGLPDGEELMIGTSPTDPDSDNDGLIDGDEIAGWMFTYRIDNQGTRIQTRVWSDPFTADSDEDGLSDLQERLFSLNPTVKDDASIIDELIQIDEFEFNETTAPLGIWRFDEDINATAFANVTSVGSTASCDNGVDECPIAGEDGRFGNALHFDGVNDHLTVPLSGELANQSFTISAWAKRDSLGTNHWIAGHGEWQANRGLIFGFTQGNRFRCAFLNNGVDTSTVYTDLEWHHWACTYDAETNQRIIYRDGIVVQTNTAPADYQGSGDFLIGQVANGGGSFDGLIDEVGVYSSALSQADVATLAAGAEHLNDLVVRPGATLDYQVTVSNTHTQDASGILFNKASAYEPLLKSPDVVMHFDTSDVVDTFINSSNDTFAATCAEDTCPTPNNSITKPRGCLLFECRNPVYANGQIQDESLEIAWTGDMMDFDGVDDAIHLPQLAIGPRTMIAMWVRFDQLPTQGERAYLLYSEPGAGYSAYVDSNGDLFFDHDSNGSGGKVFSNDNLLDWTNDPLEEWWHGRFEPGVWSHLMLLPSDNNQLGYAIMQGPYDRTDADNCFDPGCEWINERLATIRSVSAPQFAPGIIGNNGDNSGAFDGQIAQFAYYQSRPGKSTFSSLFGVSGNIYKDDLRHQNGNYTFASCDGNCEIAPTLLLEFEPLEGQSLTGVKNAINGAEATCSTTASCPQLSNDAQFNQSLQFDGNDYLTLEGIELNNRSFTAAFWAKRTNTNGGDYVISQGARVQNAGLHIGFRETNTFACAFYGDPLDTVATYTDTDWHHWVCDYNEATRVRRIFRDGLLVAEDVADAPYTASGPIEIGRLYGDVSFNGFLDELTILPGALPASNSSAEQGAAVLMTSPYPYIEIDRELKEFYLPFNSSQQLAGTVQTTSNAASQTQRFWQQVDATILTGDTVGNATVSNNALEMYLPFDDDNTNTTFKDLANLADATCTPDCPTAGYVGQVGRTVEFDGFDDGVIVDGVIPSGNQLTFAAWVNADQGTILDLREMGNRDLGDFIGWHGLEIDFDNAKLHGRNHTLRVPYTLPDNEWAYLTVVVSKPSDWNMAVYVNGELVGQDTLAANRVSSLGNGTALIGMQKNFSHLLHGQLDEVVIYNTAFNATQAQSLYRESRPIVEFDFDEESTADGAVNELGGVATKINGEVGFGIDGRLGSAAQFDGQAMLQMQADNRIQALADNFTMMAWIKPDELSITGVKRIMSRGRNGAAAGFGFGIRQGNLEITNWGTQTIASTAAISADQWQHVAVVYQSGQATQFYVDGVKTTGPVAGTALLPNAIDPLFIGGTTQAGVDGALVQQFNGLIDEVAIYDRAFSDAEIINTFQWQLRTYRATQAAYFTIDSDAPTINFVSNGSNRANEPAVLVVTANDPTSSVLRLEMGQSGPDDSNLVWDDAPRCEDNLLNVNTWCPTFEPSGEGRYTVQFRAVDGVGNIVTSNPSMLSVDTTAPVTSLGFGLRDQLLQATQPNKSELRWLVSLSGILDEPIPDSDSVAVTLVDATGNVVGGGSQKATAEEGIGNWLIDFEFLESRPFGSYDVYVAASDIVGNHSETMVGTIWLDERPPVHEYTAGSLNGNPFYSIQAPLFFTDSISFEGIATTGSVWPNAKLRFHFEDDNISNGLLDASGNYNNASCTNCPTTTSGLLGQALSFNGSNEVIVSGNHDYTNEGSFTVAAWVNNPSTSDFENIVSRKADVGVAPGWTLRLSNSRQATLFLGNGAERWDLIAADPIPTNEWVHMAGVVDRNSGEAKLYVNGREVAATDNLTGSFGSNADLLIGSWGLGANPDRFSGQLDDVMLYSRALTAEQIYAMSRAPLSTVSNVQFRIQNNTFDGAEPTTVRAWTNATLSPTNSATSKWSFTIVPSYIPQSGYYQILVRSIDSQGNVGRIENIWRGRIDRVDPAISSEFTVAGFDGFNYADYTVTIRDFALNTDSITHECHSWTINSSVVYNTPESPLDGQTKEITGTCRIDLDAGTAVNMQACDQANRCTDQEIHSQSIDWFFSFDEGPQSVVDSNGSDIVAAIVGNPDWSVNSGNGSPYALEMSGLGYLSVPLDQDLSDQPFTLALWAQRSTVGRQDLVTQGSIEWIGYRTTHIKSQVPAASNRELSATVDDLTAWNHFAVVSDGSRIRLYANGVEMDSTASSVFVWDTPLIIGEGMTGFIDDIRLVKRAMSAEEISNIYNGIVPPPPPSPSPTPDPNIPPTPTPDPSIVGETGTIVLSNSIDGGVIEPVTFQNNYTNPVIVAYLNTRNGGDPTQVRVTDVTANGFNIFMREARIGNLGHASETVSYIVMESGRYDLGDGLIVEAGTHTTSLVNRTGLAANGDAVMFSAEFASTPAILHSLNTHNNNGFMASVAYSVSGSGFRLQQEAAGTGSAAASETIGWIAFSTGTGTTNGFAYDINIANDGTSDGLGQPAQIINYSFAQTPIVVVSGNTANGNDGYWARSAGTYNATTSTVYAAEDTIGDTERVHTNEAFGYAAFEPGTEFSGTPISSNLGGAALGSANGVIVLVTLALVFALAAFGWLRSRRNRFDEVV